MIERRKIGRERVTETEKTERERERERVGYVCGLTHSRETQARLQKSFFNPYMIHVRYTLQTRTLSLGHTPTYPYHTSASTHTHPTILLHPPTYIHMLLGTSNWEEWNGCYVQCLFCENAINFYLLCSALTGNYWGGWGYGERKERLRWC